MWRSIAEGVRAGRTDRPPFVLMLMATVINFCLANGEEAEGIQKEGPGSAEQLEHDGRRGGPGYRNKLTASLEKRIRLLELFTLDQ